MRALRKHPLTACLLAALSIGAAGAVRAEPHGARAPGHHRLVRAESKRTPGAARAPQGVLVTNCNDAGDGSLRAAVESAVRSEIDLRALACSTITLTSGAIHPSSSLRIKGSGRDRVAIDGSALDRIFDTAYSLTLQDLTVRNGRAEGDGGCIRGLDVFLIKSTISHCDAHAAADVRGGAVSAEFASMIDSTLTSSRVQSDTAYARGGGLYAQFVDLDGSTVTANAARSVVGLGVGGGVFATVSAYSSYTTISANQADLVGGLALISRPGPYGSLLLLNSTISNNSATQHIGGLFVDSRSVIDSSTIAFNCAGETYLEPGYTAGIGMHARFIPPHIESSLLAKNTLCAARTPSGGPQVAYDVSTRDTTAILGDHNLIVSSAVPLPVDTIRSDPRLGPLADNGGPTLTHALLSGSPAIDAGSSAHNGYDQRGIGSSRTVGTAQDIGAFEVQSTGPTHTVASCADAGPGSLRDTVAQALSGDTIDLTQLPCSLITLTTGAIEIPQGNLKIVGPGASALTVDGSGVQRLFTHHGFGTLRPEGLSLKHGYADGDGGCVLSYSYLVGKNLVIEACTSIAASVSNADGGAIAAQNAALEDALIIDNSSDFGGGIWVEENLSLLRTTIANNAGRNGGGFVADTADVRDSTISQNNTSVYAAVEANDLRLTNSTVSGNHSDGGRTAGVEVGRLEVFNSTIVFNTVATDNGYGGAGGAYAYDSAHFESSIVFGNSKNSLPVDIGVGGLGTVLGSSNLIGATAATLPPDTLRADPQLSPLQNNGGPTMTHAPAAGSPVIDAGNNIAGLARDQRGPGFDRVVAGAADIGALEAQSGLHDQIFVNSFER